MLSVQECWSLWSLSLLNKRLMQHEFKFDIRTWVKQAKLSDFIGDFCVKNLNLIPASAV